MASKDALRAENSKLQAEVVRLAQENAKLREEADHYRGRWENEHLPMSAAYAKLLERKVTTGARSILSSEVIADLPSMMPPLDYDDEI